MRFAIEFIPAARAQVRALRKHDQARLFDEVERNLQHQPNVQTHNRKPMRLNPLASWELRAGHLRVYYDVLETPTPLVRILAVGVKEGNRVLIGGKEARP